MAKGAKMDKTHPCEIIYVKEKKAAGWKWRLIEANGRAKASEETYALFYECISAARARGLKPNVKCP
jgi:hypothetical protein